MCGNLSGSVELYSIVNDAFENGMLAIDFPFHARIDGASVPGGCFPTFEPLHEKSSIRGMLESSCLSRERDCEVQQKNLVVQCLMLHAQKRVITNA